MELFLRFGLALWKYLDPKVPFEQDSRIPFASKTVQKVNKKVNR